MMKCCLVHGGRRAGSTFERSVATMPLYFCFLVCYNVDDAECRNSKEQIVAFSMSSTDISPK